jgi:cobalt-zinc-cadmium efflux system outer membrane protein
LFWQGGFDRMVNFTLGVELPLWKKRKQEPLIAAAESERRAARFELTNATSDVRAEAANLLAEYQNAIAQIQRYQDGLLPQSSAALDATRASYLGGRGDFASVLDEFRRWIALRTELAGREADRYSAQARLDALFAPPSTDGSP